jgi:hypothetical protein
MEQVAGVLEIMGSVHSLEVWGAKQTDRKPGTCLTKHVQAH